MLTGVNAKRRQLKQATEGPALRRTDPPGGPTPGSDGSSCPQDFSETARRVVEKRRELLKRLAR